MALAGEDSLRKNRFERFASTRIRFRRSLTNLASAVFRSSPNPDRTNFTGKVCTASATTSGMRGTHSRLLTRPSDLNSLAEMSADLLESTPVSSSTPSGAPLTITELLLPPCRRKISVEAPHSEQRRHLTTTQLHSAGPPRAPVLTIN